MTAVPSGSGGPPGWEIPDEGVGTENVDVLALAGQPVPAGGAWLWVTAAEPRRGGNFTALFLPRQHPAACGGDVLVHVGPAGEPGETGGQGGGLGGRGRVAGPRRGLGPGRPGPVAGDRPRDGHLRDGRADGTAGARRGRRRRQQVDVIAAAGSVPSGFPSLPTQVSLGG